MGVEEAGRKAASREVLRRSSPGAAYDAPMLDLVRAYFLAFGAITITGGVIGYVKARSGATIITGTVFGGLLLVAAYLVGRGERAGLGLSFLVSAMLAGRFTKAFRRNGDFIPGGLMALLGLVGIAASLLGFAR